MKAAARFLVLAVALLVCGAAAPAAEYFPWVTARTELSEGALRAGEPSVLVQTRLHLARVVTLNDTLMHESRGETDLDLFYRRHAVPAQSMLYLLGRAQSKEIIACTLTDTYVAANMFVSGGRIDGPSCLVDRDGDGRFDEVRWGAWRVGNHALRAQSVVAHEPAAVIDVGYGALDPPTALAETQFLDVIFAYDPAHDRIEASVRGPDGAVLRRERLRLSRVRDTRTFEFFAIAIEVTRVAPGAFTWRATQTFPAGEAFRLAWRGD